MPAVIVLIAGAVETVPPAVLREIIIVSVIAAKVSATTIEPPEVQTKVPTEPGVPCLRTNVAEGAAIEIEVPGVSASANAGAIIKERAKAASERDFNKLLSTPLPKRGMKYKPVHLKH